MSAKEIELERRSLEIVGSFLRDCVGQSASKELKSAVRRLSNVELATISLFVQYVNVMAMNIPEPPIDTDQLALFN